MARGTVQHDTVRLERTFDASPAQVFAAWAQPGARDRWWYVGSDEFKILDFTTDFRVGGSEQFRAQPKGGPVFTLATRYEDIVPDSRIVFSYCVYQEETRMSASIATFELLPENSGTRVILTDQVAFLDGSDSAELRTGGWTEMLDSLTAHLTGLMVENNATNPAL